MKDDELADIAETDRVICLTDIKNLEVCTCIEVYICIQIMIRSKPISLTEQSPSKTVHVFGTRTVL